MKEREQAKYRLSRRRHRFNFKFCVFHFYFTITLQLRNARLAINLMPGKNGTGRKNARNPGSSPSGLGDGDGVKVRYLIEFFLFFV